MKTIKILLLLISFICFLFSSDSINKNQEQNIDFILDNHSKIIVDLKLGEINYSIVNKNNQDFLRLNIDNAYHSNTPGLPEFPQINNLIEIPSGSTYYIEVINDQSIEYSLDEISENIKIFPSQPSISKSENIDNISFIIDEWVYSQDKYINSNLIEITEKGKMRETQIGNLIINPFEYNPQKNKLIIHTDIKFAVHFENINFELTNQIKEKYSSVYFEPVLSGSLLNYNSTL